VRERLTPNSQAAGLPAGPPRRGLPGRHDHL